MAYSAEISRRNPTAFLFVIDQSGSMNERWEGQETKAQRVATALNRVLVTLITKCSKEDGIRRYFDVGALAYGGFGCRDALQFMGNGGLLRPIPALEQCPLRVEKRKMRIPDGIGGLLEHEVDFPVWFEPTAEGGTPMCAALQRAAHEIGAWCDIYPDAFPPTILHVTDGESTDGDPEPIANIVRQLSTHDGEVLVYNLHISSAGGAKVIFPGSEGEVTGLEARRLFRMSSGLPVAHQQAARSLNYPADEGARGYGYNADFNDLVSFFDIGTRHAQAVRESEV